MRIEQMTMSLYIYPKLDILDVRKPVCVYPLQFNNEERF